MKKALVIGLGVSGLAAAEFLQKQGFDVTGVDRNDQALKNRPFKVLNEKAVETLCSFDLVVVSPGVSPQHPLYQQAIDQNIEVIGEVELALRFTINPILAVTGTNGKTTVTMMVTHVLNACGIPAKSVGNIGKPFTELLGSDPTVVWVLELSSYQLETLQSQKIDAGVILNITPDHLDRYSSLIAYAKAKIRLQQCIKPEGMLFVHDQVLNQYQELFMSQEHVAPFLPMAHKCMIDHYEENRFAAFSLCQRMGVTLEQFEKAVNSFKAPSHRLEFVRVVNGVRYINDSKGTNIDAVKRAVESIQGDIILIAGGVDKGASYEPWSAVFAHKVKAAVLIGEASTAIDKEIGEFIETYFAETLKDAVIQANMLASDGDTVLLSPGCSSFDMFRNYEERGNMFKDLVAAI